MRGACLRGFLVFMDDGCTRVHAKPHGRRDAGEMRAFMAAVPCYYNDDADAGQYFVRGASQGERVVSSVQIWVSACTAGP